VTVFAVWQPMLPTDWSSPSSWVLARLSDSRAQQFWDENHLVAKQVAADARAPQPVPECCDESGIPWDVAALYPKGAVWTDRLPSAVFFAGPVVKFESALQTKLVEVLSSDQAHARRSRRLLRVPDARLGKPGFDPLLTEEITVSRRAFVPPPTARLRDIHADE
jgi:hypothetical protein